MRQMEQVDWVPGAKLHQATVNTEKFVQLSKQQSMRLWCIVDFC